MLGQVRVAFSVLAVLLFCALPAFAEGPTAYPSLNSPPIIQKTGSGDVAVIVAVEDYFMLPNVTGATANGNDWERFFQDGLGVPTIHFLSNRQATREQLGRFAKMAAEGVKPGGTLWYVFIGHGAPSKDGKEGLLVGVDAQQDPDSIFERGLPQQELLDILQTGQQAQTVLILDACFSGRAGDGSALAPAQPVIPTTIVPKVTSSTVILSAAQSSELAGALPGLDRPAFTYLLLGALRGWAADSSQTVTAASAQRYVQRALRGIPGRMNQTPSLFGKGDVVLARGVREADPGIVALMHKMSRSPTNTAPTPRPVVTVETNSVGAIPELPDALNPSGAIGLSADAAALVARDQALQADAAGASNPEAAIQAWKKLAGLGGNNPFREEANLRSKQWEDFSKKKKAFQAQHTADRERLQAVLPLTSLTEENKREMLESYRALYGEPEMVNLIGLVQPKDVRLKFCETYLKSGSVPVTVNMPNNRDGLPFIGRIRVGGIDFGTVPATLSLPKCAEAIGLEITEPESGKVWIGTLSGVSQGNPTVVEPVYTDLIPYSIWHDYIWAPSPSGPLLGVMYSQMNFPADFAQSGRLSGGGSTQNLRGNIELGLGAWGSHVSLWFEPSLVLGQDGQDNAYGVNGGIGLGRFTAGRFSFSPLRVGYQRMYGADLDTLEGISGHSALRFHLGNGLQLRGDAALLAAQMERSNEEDWNGWIWSVGGGLEYGHPVVSDVLEDLLDGGSNWSDNEWGEWSDGSLALGYQMSSGYLPKQSTIGSFVFTFKAAANYDSGGRIEISGAHQSAGGFDSSNIGLKVGGAWMNDDEDLIYGIGFTTGYSGFEESSFYMLGMDMHFGWRMFSQVSLNAAVELNALALTDMATETLENGEVVAFTSTMSPISSYLRWTTPWQFYMNGGVRMDLGGSIPVSYFGELGYLWGI